MKCRVAYKSSMKSRSIEMFRDDALVNFVDGNLTKKQYKDTKSSLKRNNLPFIHHTIKLLRLKTVTTFVIQQ